MKTTRIVYKSDSIMSLNGCEIVKSDGVNKSGSIHEGRLDFYNLTTGDDDVVRGTTIRSIALDQIASYETLEV